MARFRRHYACVSDNTEGFIGVDSASSCCFVVTSALPQRTPRTRDRRWQTTSVRESAAGALFCVVQVSEPLPCPPRCYPWTQLLIFFCVIEIARISLCANAPLLCNLKSQSFLSQVKCTHNLPQACWWGQDLTSRTSLVPSVPTKHRCTIC